MGVQEMLRKREEKNVEEENTIRNFNEEEIVETNNNNNNNKNDNNDNDNDNIDNDNIDNNNNDENLEDNSNIVDKIEKLKKQGNKEELKCLLFPATPGTPYAHVTQLMKKEDPFLIYSNYHLSTSLNSADKSNLKQYPVISCSCTAKFSITLAALKSVDNCDLLVFFEDPLERIKYDYSARRLPLDSNFIKRNVREGERKRGREKRKEKKGEKIIILNYYFKLYFSVFQLHWKLPQMEQTPEINFLPLPRDLDIPRKMAISIPPLVFISIMKWCVS